MFRTQSKHKFQRYDRHLLRYHAIPVRLEHFAGGTASKEMQVCLVKDTSFRMAELPKQEHNPYRDIRHIWHRDDQAPRRLKQSLAFAQQPLRLTEMFQNVHQQHLVERLTA